MPKTTRLNLPQTLLPAAIALAIAFPSSSAPIELEAGEVLSVEFNLPASLDGHNSLFLTWFHSAYSGEVSISIFEDSVLLETFSKTLTNLTLTDHSISGTNFTPTPERFTFIGDFEPIADGIANGRLDISYSNSIVLDNDTSVFIDEFIPFMQHGAFAIQTLERVNSGAVRTGNRNIATIVPEPSSLALLAIGGLGLLRRRRPRR